MNQEMVSPQTDGAANGSNSDRYEIERWGRYWAVLDRASCPEPELVCVAVYRKGALEVIKRLEEKE